MFRELSGGVGVRIDSDGTAGATLSASVLSGAFRTLTANGEVSRSGYLFKLFLPSSLGAGVEETQGAATVAATVGDDLCETTWCVYASPANYSTSGNRSFFTNQSGDIVSVDSSIYTDTDAIGPANAGAAFSESSGSGDTMITGKVAVGTLARDGNSWKQVN